MQLVFIHVSKYIVGVVVKFGTERRKSRCVRWRSSALSAGAGRDNGMMGVEVTISGSLNEIFEWKWFRWCADINIPGDDKGTKYKKN